MLKNKESYAYQLGDGVQDIISDVIDSYSAGSGQGAIKEEEQITGAITSRIETDLSPNFENYDVIPDNFTRSVETDIGADLAVLYDVDTPEITLQTGFLAQAKRYESGWYNKNKWGKLVEQCECMLDFSSDSYLIDYSQKGDGVYMIPAASIAGTDKSKFDEFYPDAWLPDKYHRKKPGEVFKLLFLGYIGSEYVYRAISVTENDVEDFRRADSLGGTYPIYADGQGREMNDETIKILKFNVSIKQE